MIQQGTTDSRAFVGGYAYAHERSRLHPGEAADEMGELIAYGAKLAGRENLSPYLLDVPGALDAQMACVLGMLLGVMKASLEGGAV